VIQECLELGVSSFDYVGGEISISEDIKDLLKACKPHKTHISLASNGYDLTREKIKQLKNMGVDKISISIDSGDEEEHDIFRSKKGSYKRCFEAIDDIKAEGLVPVIISCITRGDTQKAAFRSLVDYAIKHRIELVFSAAIPFGQWEGNLDVLCDERDIEEMKKLHQKHHFLTRDCYENMGHFGCPATKQIVYISEYGDVMPCPFMHISFGNVRYESIRDIQKRMYAVPELAEYHPRCLVGENKKFIEKYLSKTFGTKQYPITAQETFNDIPSINQKLGYVQNIAKKNRRCPLCSSPNSFIVSAGREHEFDNTTQDIFFVVQCKDCDLVYLDPRPDDSTLNIIYPKDYYCYQETYTHVLRKVSLIVRLKRALILYMGFPQRIKKLIHKVRKSQFHKLSVLDIGCGSGYALDIFREIGGDAINTTGLDVSASALNIVNQKGHSTIVGRIEDSVLPQEQFDIIYSSNVIEHVADPKCMLEKSARALKPNGLFLCEVPNYNSLDRRLWGKSGHWGGFHFPRHWTFFTAATIEKLAAECNLQIKSITYHVVPIFWIWSFHSWLRRGKGKRSIADLCFPLRENKQTFIQSFILKVLFSLIDWISKIVTGKTSLMSIVFEKKRI